jgi:three-Cys-motif partner protein
MRVGEMGLKRFFDEYREQSRINSEIVSRYFWAWAQVMAATAKRREEDKIAYIDLFAGPGRYGDDTKSTTLLVLERAVQEPDLCRMLVTLFNDKNPDYARSLREAIDSTPAFKQFRYPPQVANNQVGDEIVSEFEKRRMIPTLFFVHP